MGERDSEGELRPEQGLSKEAAPGCHFQNCIVSLMTGNENMESSDRKMPLPKNMPGRTVASCQVEPEGAGADYSFWHKSCYASE
jgi:hypothetical protein